MRNHRQATLRELNRFDVERIMDENVDLLLRLETANIESINAPGGPVVYDAARAADVSDSMAEVNHILSLLLFQDDIEARILSGPLYHSRREGF